MNMILEGIRVIDWTGHQFGPISTSMLGDLGADVIKIEQRGIGDPSRGMDRFAGVRTMLPNGHTLVYESCNRNKKGITVDLKKEEGRQIVYRLVEKSDVFVQNFRPGAAARMHVDYATLSKINPKLVYASGSGFGARGPDACRTSLDPMGQARSGFMHAAADPGGDPMYVPGAIADQMGAVMLSYGILAGLLARERLGIGQEIDVSHVGSMINLQLLSVMGALLLGQGFSRQKRTELTNPLANHYKCKDGKWLFFALIQSDKYWPSFCRALGIENMEKDPRFVASSKRAENRAQLISILDKAFATKTCAEWDEIFSKGDFIYSRIQRLTDLANDPQILANEYIVDYDHPALGPVKVIGFPVAYSQTPASIRMPSPVYGQHTEEVLMEVGGYSWDEIEGFKDREVI
ncbi:MAG: CoA transferase [Chloroflexi bacterium]|nr:CoA transferase [Chloroflexota bacterium]